jgi:hypothetical protein
MSHFATHCMIHRTTTLGARSAHFSRLIIEMQTTQLDYSQLKDRLTHGQEQRRKENKIERNLTNLGMEYPQ